MQNKNIKIYVKIIMNMIIYTTNFSALIRITGHFGFIKCYEKSMRSWYIYLFEHWINSVITTFVFIGQKFSIKLEKWQKNNYFEAVGEAPITWTTVFTSLREIVKLFADLKWEWFTKQFSNFIQLPSHLSWTRRGW